MLLKQEYQLYNHIAIFSMPLHFVLFKLFDYAGNNGIIYFTPMPDLCYPYGVHSKANNVIGTRFWADLPQTEELHGENKVK